MSQRERVLKKRTVSKRCQGEAIFMFLQEELFPIISWLPVTLKQTVLSYINYRPTATCLFPLFKIVLKDHFKTKFFQLGSCKEEVKENLCRQVF